MINEDKMLDAIEEIDIRISCGYNFDKAVKNAVFFDLNEDETNLLLGLVNNLSSIFGIRKENSIQLLYNGFLKGMV